MIGDKKFSVKRMIAAAQTHPHQTKLTRVAIDDLSGQLHAYVWTNDEDPSNTLFTPMMVLTEPSLSPLHYDKIMRTGTEINKYPPILITITDSTARFLNLPLEYVGKVWVVDGNHRLAYYWNTFHGRQPPFYVNVQFISEELLSKSLL